MSAPHPENASRHYLELVYGLNPEAHRDYNSAYGYLLKQGQDWQAQPLPKGIEQGEAKQCYVNAYLLAVRNPGKYFYVEGIAMAVIPTDHAWCVDRQGRVIDCTPHWENGRDYFGVKFDLKTLHAIQRITQGYGALPHWEHWPEIRHLLGLGPKPRARRARRRPFDQRRATA